MSDAVVWILLLIMTTGTLFASVFIFQVKGLVVRLLEKANAEDTARALNTQTLRNIEKNGALNIEKMDTFIELQKTALWENKQDHDYFKQQIANFNHPPVNRNPAGGVFGGSHDTPPPLTPEYGFRTGDHHLGRGRP